MVTGFRHGVVRIECWRRRKPLLEKLALTKICWTGWSVGSLSQGEQLFTGAHVRADEIQKAG